MTRIRTMPRSRFLLRARLNEHKRKVAAARACVADWLSQCANPYIAFSAGKDSTCVLRLVREVDPSVPAVYFDAQCAFPEVKELLAATPNTKCFPADEPFIATLKRHGLHGGASLDRATMQSTVWGPAARLIAEFGYDGFAYGLREQESRGRRLNSYVRGRIFRYKESGILACQPICDWTYDDVWAFIAANDIPYCKTYDRMWDLPEHAQRISYWAGETGRENGRYVWLKRTYPELFNTLASEIPDARAYA